MLRLFVLILLLTNGVYYAWSNGLLRPYGFAPEQVAEPQRLASQIRPEALVILTPDEARKAEANGPVTSATRAAECQQAGPFDEVQALVLKQTLDKMLPASAWRLDELTQPARWIVYIGKFASSQALAAKRAELAALNVRIEPLVNPAMEPGLSLGAYEVRGGAENRLEALQARGVRTASVVQERAPTVTSTLRLTVPDDLWKTHQEEIKAALGDKPLRACK